MKIFPPGLAVLGTVLSDIRIRDAPVVVFRGRWVDPNSIFCRGHEGYGVTQTYLTLVQHMDVWSHVIDECGPKRIKKIGLRQISENNRRESVNPEGQGKSPFSP